MEPVNDPSSKIRKLETVIRKGDMLLGILEKKGVGTDPFREQMEQAKEKLESGRVEESFKLAMQCIKGLKQLKESTRTEKEPVAEFEKSKRGKGVFALIRDNNVEMEKKINEWKVIITGWRKKGYHFESDKSLFSRPFEQIEKRFISIGEQIEKAEEIRGRISRLREEFSHVGKVYLKKFDSIEQAVFRLDRLDNIERRLKSLVGTLKEVEGRYRTFRNRIGRFRMKGLSTSSLEEMLDNDEDFDYLEKQFKIYESNIEFLIKEKQKLKMLKKDPMAERLTERFEKLEKIIDDPWKLDLVVEEMMDLERSINEMKEIDKKQLETRKRKNEIRKSLERYQEEGFKVDMVSQLLDDDINLLEEEYDIFIRQTARLKALKEQLFQLDAAGFEEEVASISRKLFDPTQIDEVETELNDLKERILSHKMRSQRITNAIKEWSGMGFKISKLENALKSDIDEAERIMEDYRKRIEELTDYETRLKEMKLREMRDLVHKVSLKIKNPELIDSVRKEMAIIQKKAVETDSIRQKRMELNSLLKTWKSQGYRIERIFENAGREQTLRGLDEVILKYTRAVAALEALRNEFPSFERGWFPDLEEEIRKNMDDPLMSKQTLDRFSELKKIIKKEEKRRGEISRKLKELSSRGIDVSNIEPLLTGDSELLTSRYNEFKERVKKLLKLKARLLKEAHSKKDKALEEFARSISDPFKVDVYEEQVLQRESGESIPMEPEKKPDTDISNIKEEAKELYRKGELEASLKLFEKVLESDPENKECLFYKKKVTSKLKTLEKAAVSNGMVKVKVTDGESEKDEKEHMGGDPNCLSCRGTGECVWCSGTGKCSTCSGTGKTFNEQCPTCKGTGKCTVCKGTGKCSWCNPA
ncbi:MAG: hypothetical protein DRN57_02580 [Thermoplasmata archaeon]|nr:MAG: hypothetical protein DRN57_02580 [Thermoplasmata archaeon]